MEGAEDIALLISTFVMRASAGLDATYGNAAMASASAVLLGIFIGPPPRVLSGIYPPVALPLQFSSVINS